MAGALIVLNEKFGGSVSFLARRQQLLQVQIRDLADQLQSAKRHCNRVVFALIHRVIVPLQTRSHL